MNNFKFKLLFIPFVIIGLVTVGIYTFLHWLLLLKFNVFIVGKDWVNFLIPMGITAVPLIIWLRRLRLRLNLKDNATGGTYLLIAAWVTIWAATCIVQVYLDMATGKPTELDYISQVDTLAKTKYYEVKHFYIDKRKVGVKTTFDISGEHNEHFDMSIYVVVPIFDQKEPSNTFSKVSVVPPAWLILKYHKTIENKLLPEEKEAKRKVFIGDFQKDFDSNPMERFVYLDRVGLGKDKKNYLEAIKAKNSTITNPVLLTPVYEPFEARFSHKLPWIFQAFGIGLIIFLMILRFIPLKETTNEAIFEVIATKSSDGMELKNIFRESYRKGYSVTLIIIVLNLLIYIAMIFAGLGFITFNGTDLLKWGANYRPAIENGRYWRLLTNMFLHGNQMSLIWDIYGLTSVGRFLEPLMGSTRYLIAYLFTGVVASVTSVWWHPATISSGASGAIFGMAGILLALLTTNLFPSTFKKSLIKTAIFVVCSSLTQGIDNAAHIGGLISGLLIGYALYPFLKQRANEVDAKDEGE